VEAQFEELGLLVKGFREKINETSEREKLMREETKILIRNIENDIECMSDVCASFNLFLFF
jgi:hypothetical protein